MLTIYLWLHGAAAPIIYTNVFNAYSKGDMYCIALTADAHHVLKHPLCSIYLSDEQYTPIDYGAEG